MTLAVKSIIIATAAFSFGLICFYHKSVFSSKPLVYVSTQSWTTFYQPNASLREDLMRMNVTKKFIVVTSVALPTEDVKVSSSVQEIPESSRKLLNIDFFDF